MSISFSLRYIPGCTIDYILPFSLNCFIAIVRRHVCRSVVSKLTVQSINSLDRVSSIPLGSPVVGLLPFSPCSSISFADDEQLYRCASVPRDSLVGAGCTTSRWRWGYWLHFITPNKRLKPLTLFQTGKGILTYVKFERMWIKPLLPCTERYITMPHYLLTPWSRVPLEKLTGLQLVKKFPAFYGTRRFLAELTSARHLSLSWASPVQS
jgi:hypothetical protein